MFAFYDLTFYRISYGTLYEPFQFVVVTTVKRQNASAIFESFDLYTWLGVVCTSLLTLVFVGCLNGFHEVNEILFWIGGTLIGQITPSLPERIKSKFGLIVASVLVLWMLVSYLIAFFFQGNLFSSLISTKLPKVPESLRDAIRINMSLYTIDTICDQGCSSTLKTFIIPDLKFIADYEGDVAFKNFIFKIDKQLTNFSNLNLLFFNTLENSSYTSNSFGLIDSQKLTKCASRQLKLLFQNRVILGNHDLNPFVKRSIWTVTPNILYLKFLFVLKGLDCSGLIRYWESNFNSLYDFYSSKILLFARQCRQKHVNKYTVRMMMENRIFNWLGAHTLSVTFEDLKSEANPVSFNAMFYPVCFVFIMNGVMLVVFLVKKSISWISSPLILTCVIVKVNTGL